MGQEFSIKNTLNRIGYRFSWKLLELITLIFLARILIIRDFGIALFAMTGVYFILRFVKITYPEKDAARVKHFYNALSVAAPIFGVVTAGIIILVSFLLPIGVLSATLKFVAVIVMFSTFSLAPVTFFQNRHDYEKLYRAYTTSQVLMAALSIFLAVKGFGYMSILYGYTLFYIFNAFWLWWKMPFSIKPKLSMEHLKEIFSHLRMDIGGSALTAFLTQGILLYSAVAFGMIAFSYVFIAYTVGFFFYENITLFITNLLLPLFTDFAKNDDLFKFNLVRLIEYFAFIIIPISTIAIVLSREITLIVLGNVWETASEAIGLFLFAGIIKGIFETTRIVFIVKNKTYLFDHIRMIELFFLVIFTLTLSRFLSYTGLALAVLICTIISSSLYMLASQRLTKINVITVSKDYFYIISAGILTGLLTALMKELFDISNPPALIFSVLIGLLIYIGLTFLFNKDLYKRVIRFAFTLED